LAPNLLNGGHGIFSKKKMHQTKMFYRWLDAKLLGLSEKNISKHEVVVKAF